MENEKLIEKLVGSLTVVPTVRVSRYVFIGAMVTILISVYFLVLIGIRQDWWQRLQDPSFLLAVAFFLTSYFLGLLFAIKTAVPDENKQAVPQHIITISLVLAMLSYSRIWTLDIEGFKHVGSLEMLMCCLSISCGAVAPVAILTVLFIKLAALRYALSFRYSWLGGTAAISLVSAFHCPYRNPEHILAGHGVLLACVIIFYYLLSKPIVNFLYNKNMQWRLGDISK